jgi:glycerol-3-phosphate dehydrogenase (NAD(P)+)
MIIEKKVAVIGAGGWGIALAKLLAEKPRSVTLWCHGSDSFRELAETRQSVAYLPGIDLPASVEVTQSLREAAAGAWMAICAVPSHAVRDVMKGAAAHMPSDAIMLCGTKGLEEQSLKTMAEVLAEIAGDEAKDRHAFISGPSFALEVARGLPTAVTVAAYADRVATDIQEALSTHNFRVYTSKDVTGVQMGGVIKNVVAIAAGISDGLGLGQNARAALITRGLAEMIRLAVRMGADPVTLAGLPGLGDMVLTCSGDLSRNRKVGLQIAQGRALQEIVTETRTVAEGVRNTRSVHLLAAKLGVEMPIVEQMYQVLYGGKKPFAAVRDLMQRSLKPENS